MGLPLDIFGFFDAVPRGLVLAAQTLTIGGGVFLALLARPLRPAFAGITAGWARWLELRLDGRAQRVAAWIWPVAFLVVGAVLPLYREA